MPRDGAAARVRLREAALELYQERGFDATTTAEIAERAGVTERTYFRHFADKREAIFDGEDELKAVLSAAIASAPAALRPLEVLRLAFRAAVPLFVAGRPIAERRARIIETVPALLERADAKRAAVVASLADALGARGLAAPSARLAAQVGMAAFGRASADWNGMSGSDLEEAVDAAFAEVRALA